MVSTEVQQILFLTTQNLPKFQTVFNSFFETLLDFLQSLIDFQSKIRIFSQRIQLYNLSNTISAQAQDTLVKGNYQKEDFGEQILALQQIEHQNSQNFEASLKQIKKIISGEIKFLLENPGKINSGKKVSSLLLEELEKMNFDLREVKIGQSLVDELQLIVAEEIHSLNKTDFINYHIKEKIVEELSSFLKDLLK